MTTAALTDRQQREHDYHRDHAAKHAGKALDPVATDVIADTARRPWNAYWSMYDRILAAGLAGKAVLVLGCGFGDDAIRVAKIGAHVSACDLSPEAIDIARARAANSGVAIDFGVMPAEALTYPDDSFDAVVFVDILHHVDIPATVAEVARVLRPGAQVIGDELYTHSGVQRWRESTLVERGLYPLMRRWIYGKDQPYITEDEHKIDEHEFAQITRVLTGLETDWFNIVEGRLYPTSLVWAARAERAIAKHFRRFAPYVAGRVVFSGRLA